MLASQLRAERRFCLFGPEILDYVAAKSLCHFYRRSEMLRASRSSLAARCTGFEGELYYQEATRAALQTSQCPALPLV